MANTGVITGLVLAAAVMAGCAAQVDSTRSVTVGGDVFGYHQYEGAALRYPELSTGSSGGIGAGVRSGLVITVMTRNGAPVSEMDRGDVQRVARLLCERTQRRWYDQDRGVFLPGGGLSFAGACG